MKTKIISFLLFISTGLSSFAQLDYDLMYNWSLHPNKNGTLIDGYNLNIAVVDENLNTNAVYQITNNAMTNTGVDVFFVHPTLLPDLFAYSTRETIPLSDQQSWIISASIVGQAGLLAKYGRFFAPRYRQSSPPTYLRSPSDLTQAAIIGEAYMDIKASFLHYMKNYNNGNKIILASHSQGAYLSAMLLRDVFDNDFDLQNKLVTAIIGGAQSVYAEPYQHKGGWWKNIPLCTEMNQCNCVMTWRSYKDGQSIPEPVSSLPFFNPHFVENNLLYRLMNISKDKFMQDSIYYSTESVPLRNYLVPKTNQPYGGNVGFIAFDNLYQIRVQRDAATKIGFAVKHTPKPNDQRPNDLLEEELSPMFLYQGYHHKDYNIYTWALMEQIDMKLAACGNTSGLNEPDFNNNLVQLFSNPTYNMLKIKSYQSISKIEIFNFQGQITKTLKAKDNELNISIKELPSGLFFVKADLNNGNIWTGKLIKE